MKKKSFKPATLICPVPAVLVSCSDGVRDNIITVAWTGIISSEPAMTYISIRPTRYSYDLIKKSQEFVINLTTKDLAYATDMVGVKTGAKIDKFKELKLTKQKASMVKCPMIQESPVSIECKVTEIKELGSHHMFLANIVAVNVDDEYIDTNGKFDFEKAHLIAYSHGGYYELGTKLGKFGYSVEKKNK